ncbi:MAG: hypothetical protein GXO77_16665 [Calditrichaeota bacterium]|nr:hypothetical protein [Calditrichota bacterium]
MDNKESTNNERAYELLEEIFNLWSDISKDENGDELRQPASEDEVRKSREMLDEVLRLQITDETVKERYDQLNGIVTDYEETFAYQKSPNGQAENLVNEIFNLWSNVWEEDGTEYHSPANDEEIKQSWAIIKKIEKIDFDDEEIKERLQTCREVLESSKKTKTEENEDDWLAWEKLDEIYSLWSDVNVEDGQEYRSPYNRKEIKASRAIMRKIKSMNVTDQEVLDRIEELENVLNSTNAAIPSYKGRIIRAIAFSLLVIIGFFYFPNMNKFKAPEYEYNKEWFTTEKGGYLTWKSFVSKKQMSGTKQKIYLKPGTELKPMGRLGRYWFQVETPGGQRGFVNFTLLKGARYVKADDDAKIFNKIGAKKTKSVAPGTKATVLGRTERKVNNFTYTYIKIKFEDRKVKWANDYDFDNLIFNNIPHINQTYYYHTTPNTLRRQMIGKPLTEIEKRYGTATSVIKANGKNQAFFRHLIVVDGKKHYKGLLVKLDGNNVAKDMEYTGKAGTRFYDHFPLVKEMWKFEPNRISNASFYRTTENKINFQWWDDFKNMNWFTKIIGWIVFIIILLLGIFLLFSIPRLLVSPAMQLFTFTRFFGNGMVKFISFLIYLSAAYLFFVYMILFLDQWVLPAIASVIVFGFWWKQHLSNISYNRCPSCRTMYSALNEGETYTGRSKNVTWGSYDVYKGKTETESTITHNYERRSKKTTEIIDHYLDHRMCARCGSRWDVDREEKESYTEHL